MREVLRSSSYFLVYSRSNSSASLRYTEKKSARELLVLSGSKNSFRAEWTRRLRCEVILVSTIIKWGRHTILDLVGPPQVRLRAFYLEEENPLR